eukprot:jgi/Chlat1/5164/Chrsp33S05038
MGIEVVGDGRRGTPNVLVTGTPGTGKTSLAARVAAATDLRHVNVGDLVKEKSLHDGYDEEHEAYIIDEDKICDAMEDQMSAGGNVVDYHSCDFFPQRWFDLVVVLQTDNTVLYDRLEKRGYPDAKVQENVECEIMQVLLEEARESYKEEIIQACPSNTVEDLDRNVDSIVAWINSRKARTS